MQEVFSKRVFLLIFILLLTPAISHAQVFQLKFITESQTIKPAEISEALTIQAQDSSGNPQQTPETIDLIFTSSSPTGEFLGASGNPATKTMNTNTANRTFYYRDSATGTFSLTVSGTGRTSGQTWDATQTITVSSSQGSSSNNQDDNSDTSNSNSSSSNQSSTNSAHYGATPIVSTKSTTSITLSAGRDRVGSVGTPMEFKAETNLKYGRGSVFKWNFGDGTESAGNITSHTYEYPGEYIVVLKVPTAEGEVVSRLKVKIINPEVKVLSANPERIEVLNSSNNEVNLFGRVLLVGEEVFAFPQDTIIGAGQKIFFSSKVTKLFPKEVTQVSLMAVGEGVSEIKVVAMAHQQKLEKIASLQSELSNLQAQLSSLRVKNNTEIIPPVIQNNFADDTKTDALQTANALDALSQIEFAEEGFFAKLKKFFLRTK
jgi:hypothetical protein